MKVPQAVKLPSGQWRVQVMVNGERLSVTRETEEIAVADALAIKAGIKAAEKQPKDRILLKEAITQYIDSRRNVLSPSTIMGYVGIQDNRFKSLLKKSIHVIDETELQKAINGEAASCSCKTIKNAMGLVLSVISDYKAINAKRLRYPQRIKSEHTYLDTGQIVDLIAACQGNIAEIPILLAVWLGLRRSEIMGLHWESIDFAKKEIKIERALVPNDKGDYVEKVQLKNMSSRRTLACPDYILEKLQKYQPEKGKRIGRVFQIDPSVIYNNLKKLCEKNGIPFVGVHGLRHTNASVMLSLGIVDKIAMKRGGWATDNTMKSVYQHVFSSDKKTADDVINTYFESLIENSSSGQE